MILTRTAVRASPMPPGETLAAFAATGATLAIHLSINNLAHVVRELSPVYGADCPAVVVYRASWPDQRIIRGTLATIRGQTKGLGITRTALILVGRALDPHPSTTAASTPPTTTTCCARSHGRSSHASAAATLSTSGPAGGGGRRTMMTGSPSARAAASFA